jgi:sulfur carrier protein ThiS
MVRLNGHTLTVAHGTTLEELADKLWIGASLRVEHFIVDGTFVDRSEWPNRVVADQSEIAAWEAGPVSSPETSDDW